MGERGDSTAIESSVNMFKEGRGLNGMISAALGTVLGIASWARGSVISAAGGLVSHVVGFGGMGLVVPATDAFVLSE